MMTRERAIEAIVAVWTQRDYEFCVGREESDRSAAEMHDALVALGVSPVDIPPRPY